MRKVKWVLAVLFLCSVINVYASDEVEDLPQKQTTTYFCKIGQGVVGIGTLIWGVKDTCFARGVLAPLFNCEPDNGFFPVSSLQEIIESTGYFCFSWIKQQGIMLMPYPSDSLIGFPSIPDYLHKEKCLKVLYSVSRTETTSPVGIYKESVRDYSFNLEELDFLDIGMGVVGGCLLIESLYRLYQYSKSKKLKEQ